MMGIPQGSEQRKGLPQLHCRSTFGLLCRSSAGVKGRIRVWK